MKIKSIIENNKFLLLLGLILLSLVMHFHAFKFDLSGIHAWRQTETQTTIQNFYEEDFNIFNPRINSRGAGTGIVRREFPVMQWLFAGAYKIFGDHIIISRILTFIIGILTVIGFYLIILRLTGDTFVSIAGAWAFNFSPSFFYYTVCPLPDNFALMNIVFSIYFFLKSMENYRLKYFTWSIVFLSLSALTKLPFILYFILPAWFLYRNGIKIKKIRGKSFNTAIIILLMGLLPVFLWYGLTIPQWGKQGIITGVFGNYKTDLPTLLDFFQHNLISTLPELLLNYGATPFFLVALFYVFRKKIVINKSYRGFLLLGILLILYFFFELNMIEKIHDYYLFPFLPLLFILVAYGIKLGFYNNKSFIRSFSFFLLLLIPFLAFIRIHGRWDINRLGLNPDLYNYKTELREIIPDNKLVIAGNDESSYIFFYYIHKKGWSFAHDDLNEKELKKMINEGAVYLYSSSRNVDENPKIKKYLNKKLGQYGSIKIFLLKNK